MKEYALFALGLLVSGCSPSPDNDPVYAALKANPPTEIPSKYLPQLRERRSACDVFNEGKPNQQYMTCWFPSGAPSEAYLAYFAPNPLSPPHPSKLISPGGQTVIRIKFP
jgi:hypothetical protein